MLCIGPLLEPYRSRSLEMAVAQCRGDSTRGILLIPGPIDCMLKVIVSTGRGWEHVSVSRADPGTTISDQTPPSWKEMEYVRRLLWDPEDTVIQIHPPLNKYVNKHTGVLHLWRKLDMEIPLPDPDMI